MPLRAHNRSFCTTALLALLSNAALAGGPLTPPSGPLTETPGPEPRTAVNDLPGDGMAKHIISKPGSYYLADSIEVATPGMDGVRITTPGPVSIDGMGFSVIGVPGAGIGLRVEDDTPQPLQYKLQRCWVKGWSLSTSIDEGPGDTNAPTDDLLILEDVHIDQTDLGMPALIWNGNLIVRASSMRGGGILNTGGSLTISDSTISGNAAQGGTTAHAIEADGLFMSNVEVRGGAGVKAKKDREIVVVGSKVIDPVAGIALELAAGAVVTDSQVHGTVDAHDFAIWQRNGLTMDFDDPNVVTSTFGAGSRIEDSVFRVLGAMGSGEAAVEVEQDSGYLFAWVDFAGSGTPGSLVRFTGGGTEIADCRVTGIPAACAGFEMNGAFNVMHGNVLVGEGTASLGVVGTASQSIFRNNDILNVGVAFDLFGPGGNHIGPTLTPSAASTNMHPDRNLLVLPAPPVR